MQTTTVLLLVLAALVSFAVAWYQYLYKKKQSNLNRILAVLRFGLLFCLALLLIGPEFTKSRNYIEKTKLVVAVDNSASIAAVGGEAPPSFHWMPILFQRAWQPPILWILKRQGPI